jgi:hypothetical protein
LTPSGGAPRARGTARDPSPRRVEGSPAGTRPLAGKLKEAGKSPGEAPRASVPKASPLPRNEGARGGARRRAPSVARPRPGALFPELRAPSKGRALGRRGIRPTLKLSAARFRARSVWAGPAAREFQEDSRRPSALSQKKAPAGKSGRYGKPKSSDPQKRPPRSAQGGQRKEFLIDVKNILYFLLSCQ